MQFSILGIFSASWAITFQHLLRTYAIGLIYLLVTALLFSVAGLFMYFFKEQTALGFFVMLAAGVGFGMTITAVFNYWVRFAALGQGRALHSTFGGMAKSAIINLIKFFFITLIIGIVLIVVSAGLVAIGLVQPVTTQEGIDLTSISGFLDYYSQSVTPGQLAVQLISLSVGCVVYSLFSANLTGTALGDEREGLEHPHTLDFAIALLLIDAVVVLPLFLLLMAGFPILSIILNVVVSFPMMAAISIAHGIRYRMCLAARDEGYSGAA